MHCSTFDRPWSRCPLATLLHLGYSVIAPCITLPPPSLESCSLRSSTSLHPCRSQYVVLVGCTRSPFHTRLYLVPPWTRISLTLAHLHRYSDAARGYCSCSNSSRVAIDNVVVMLSSCYVLVVVLPCSRPRRSLSDDTHASLFGHYGLPRQLGCCSRHNSNSYIPVVVLHALLYLLRPCSRSLS